MFDVRCHGSVEMMAETLGCVLTSEVSPWYTWSLGQMVSVGDSLYHECHPVWPGSCHHIRDLCSVPDCITLITWVQPSLSHLSPKCCTQVARIKFWVWVKSSLNNIYILVIKNSGHSGEVMIMIDSAACSEPSCGPSPPIVTIIVRLGIKPH